MHSPKHSAVVRSLSNYRVIASPAFNLVVDRGKCGDNLYGADASTRKNLSSVVGIVLEIKATSRVERTLSVSI